MQFAPGWKMTLLVAILLPTVLALGTWQVNRGAYKRALETDYLNRLTMLRFSGYAWWVSSPLRVF